MMKCDKIQELKDRLIKFDWFYGYTCDQSVWSKWNIESIDIQKLAESLGDEGKAIYEAACAANNAGESVKEALEKF